MKTTLEKTDPATDHGLREALASAGTAPYFENQQQQLALYQGDSLKLLAQMPPDCVDMIFADPPYFLSNGGIIII